MNVIDQAILEATEALAKHSPRRRAMYVLHQPADYLQRMLNVVKRGTYFGPHVHPEKLEFYVIVKGKLAVNIFDDLGHLKEQAILGQGDILAEIPPGTWHTVVVLSSTAAFIEIIEGYYDPATHKKFADWAPKEGDPAANAYLARLEKEALATAKARTKTKK